MNILLGMKTHQWLIIVCLLLVSPWCVATHDIQVLGGTDFSTDPTKITQLPAASFQSVKSNRLPNSSSWWLYIELENSSDQYITRHILFNNVLIPKLSAYQHLDGELRIQRSGFEVPIDERVIANELNIFSYSVPPRSVVPIYIQANLGFFPDLSYRVMSPQQTFNYLSVYHSVTLVPLLILFTLFIYNTLILLRTGDAAFRVYVTYLFFALGATFSLYNKFSWFTNNIVDPYLLLCITGVLFYSSAFLFFKEILKSSLSRWSITLLNVLIGFALLHLAITLVSPELTLSIYSKYGSGIIFMLGISYLLFDGLIKQHPLAKYLALGWGVFLVGNTIFLLSINGVLPPSYQYSFMYAMAVEAIIFSFILAERFTVERAKLHKSEVERSQIIDELKDSQRIAKLGTFKYFADDSVYLSAQALQIWRLKKHNFHTLDELLFSVLASDRELVQRRFRESLSAVQGITVDFKFQLTTHEKQRQYDPVVLYCQFESFYDDDKQQSGIQGVFQDITEQEAKDRQIQEAKALSDAKNEFIAAVSHELRTPLNGILGVLHALRDYVDADRPKTLITYAQKASEQLLNLIGEILDLSKLQSRALTLNPTSCDLEQETVAVVNTLQTVAQSKQLQLSLNVENQVNRPVLIDRGRYNQILYNLISNAIKFTEYGDVTVHLWLTTADDEQANVLLRVDDTGTGIPEAFIPRLFDRFTQVESNIAKKQGSGLGLAITKELVDLMNGDISVKSIVGKGTCFTVQLLVNISEAETASGIEVNASNIRFENVKVLCAEDNQLNRVVVYEYLKHTGITLIFAEDGQSAVSKFQQHAHAGGPFDCVLMDLQMPVMDGFEATREIRKLSTVPIIGLSAHAVEEQQRKALEHGMSDFITKPVPPEVLITTLAKVCAHHVAPSGVDTGATQPPEPLSKQACPAEPTANFDYNRLRESLGNQTAIVNNLLQLYIDDTKAHWGKLQQYAVNGDADAVAKSAHYIKGASQNIFAHSFVEYIKRIETAASDKDLGAVKSHLPEAKQAFDRLVHELASYIG